jgi:hypothetical protein
MFALPIAFEKSMIVEKLTEPVYKLMLSSVYIDVSRIQEKNRLSFFIVDQENEILN